MGGNKYPLVMRKMTPRKIERFTPRSLSEEVALLRNDTRSFSETQKYLAPLVESALTRANLSGKQASDVRRGLRTDIPLAASRYLTGAGTSRAIRFAVYFTWYIARRINAVAAIALDDGGDSSEKEP